MNERRRFSSPRQSRMFLPLPLRDDPAAWETIGTNQAGIEAFSRDGLEQDCSEQLMREEGPSDDSDNDTVQEMEPVIECLLKNSFFRSEFEGEKFISLADCVMQRATLCSEEKRIHIIKAGIVSSLARKLSSILCLTKTQTEQLFRFWKTMIVFVSPQSEEISRRIHASYSSCVRHTLRDEQQKKNACRRYFGECSFFSIALDSTLVRNENLLSCFARFSFHDHIIQVPVFFDICHDKTGNGIAQFVFTKLLENDVVFEKLVSVCTDGASNMTGRFGGMTSVLKQLVQQHCTRMGRPFNDFHTVWCLAHRMNLVTKDFLELKGLNIVKAFSDWFSDSHRQTAYKTFVAERACNQRLKSIPRPSNTRWLFYHDVVSAILSQRESVVDFIAGNEDFQKLWNSLRRQKLTFGELVEQDFSVQDITFLSLFQFVEFVLDLLGKANHAFQERYLMIWDAWCIVNSIKQHFFHLITKIQISPESFTFMSGVDRAHTEKLTSFIQQLIQSISLHFPCPSASHDMRGMGSCLSIEFEDDSIRHNPFEVNCSISKLFDCVSLDIQNDENNSQNTLDEDILAELTNLRGEIRRHRERINVFQAERN